MSLKGALARGFCCVQVNSVLKSLLITFTHITYKGALSQGFCCVQVNSVLKSLLITFTHITYKGALSQGFCCVQVNSVLKSLLITFTRTQNELRRRYKKKISRDSKFFFSIFFFKTA